MPPSLLHLIQHFLLGACLLEVVTGLLVVDLHADNCLEELDGRLEVLVLVGLDALLVDVLQLARDRLTPILQGSEP